MQIIDQKEVEGRLVQLDKGNLLLLSDDPSFITNVKLLCFLRERRRIIDLTNIIEKREIMLT